MVGRNVVVMLLFREIVVFLILTTLHSSLLFYCHTAIRSQEIGPSSPRSAQQPGTTLYTSATATYAATPSSSSSSSSSSGVVNWPLEGVLNRWRCWLCVFTLVYKYMCLYLFSFYLCTFFSYFFINFLSIIHCIKISASSGRRCGRSG